MAMASSTTTFGGGNPQNVMLTRSVDMGSSNSLVALLNHNPQLLSFQAGAGGLEEAIVGSKRGFQCNYGVASSAFEGGCEGGELGEDLGDGEMGAGPVEKKRRLSFDQVRSLERNFEMENKLEPERKMQLAKELGLQPRQVAVWFQNRRARWKTKQLERDYEMLNSGYLKLKADFETALKEKDVLKAEVQRLSGKGGGDSGPTESGSQCESDDLPNKNNNKKKETTTSSEAGSRNSSSDLLDADSPSPRTADSNHHLHHQQLPTDPIYDFTAPQADDDDDEDAIVAAVKLEDHATFFLPPMVEPHGVLPWWDWA